MKRCPTCDKTFADGLKFCQTDGTLLIDDAPPADPYKTVVGNQSGIASAIPPVDPFKTMVASPPLRAAEEDVLDLPEDINSLKTMVVSPDEMKEALKPGETEDVPKLDLPPPVPIIEPKVATPSDFPPPFGDLSSPESNFPKPSEPIQSGARDVNSSAENAPSKFDSNPSPNDFTTQSPYGNQENKPIPSPFDGSMIGYQPPSAPPPFDTPKPPPVKEPEPMFGGNQQESPNQSPFQPPSPFGQPEPFNQPMQQSDWTPPPAPMSEWQNQDLGANTPFQPPPPAMGGQDQTLAIVSLVCGILGIVCCQIVAPVAIITGFMAKKKATENPMQFGGSGMALAGIITGGIGTLLLFGVILYYIIVIAVVASQ